MKEQRIPEERNSNNTKNNNCDCADPEINVSSYQEDTACSESVKQVFPVAFYCAMSNELLKDPVVASDGNSYERDTILASGIHQEDELYFNRSLKTIIDETLALSGDSIFRGVREILGRLTTPDASCYMRVAMGFSS